MLKRIDVVAAVIFNAEQSSVLISKRRRDQHQGGLWEFPGGKKEPMESAEQALSREILEEIGIEVLQAKQLMQVSHNYPDKLILLDVWVVEGWSGQPEGLEGQEIKWVFLRDLVGYKFPEANMPILQKVLSEYL